MCYLRVARLLLINVVEDTHGGENDNAIKNQNHKAQ